MNSKMILGLLGWLLVGLSLPAAGQYQTLGQGIARQGEIQQFALDSTHNLLFAQGTFDSLGDGTTAHQLAYWDGTLWRPVPGISDTNCQAPCGRFYEIYWRKDTLWYARFSGGLDGTKIHIGWISDIGTNWTHAEDTNTTNGLIRIFFEFRDTLYLTGSFDTINGMPSHGIAKREGNQWVGITSPFPNLQGQFKGVFEDQGELYIYGNFSFPGGLNEIMRWNGEQTLSTVGNDGFEGGFAAVESMIRYQGEIYVAGSFYTADGNEANNICKLVNNQFVPFGSGLNFNPDGSGTTGVGSMQVWNGYLVVLGNFRYANGFLSPELSFWDGSRWCLPDSWYPTGGATGFWRMTQYNGDLIATLPNWPVLPGGDTLKGPVFLPPEPPHACGPPLSIPENSREGGPKLYPNPVSDLLFIESPQAGTLEVVNSMGQVVAVVGISIGKVGLPTFHLAPGWYTARVITSSGQVVYQSFVKTP